MNSNGENSDEVMNGTRKLQRHHKHGIVLLSTLVSVLLLAALIGVVQHRSQSNLLVLSRLERLHHDAPQRDAAFERFRGIIADAMALETAPASGLRLDGSPFAIAQGGTTWSAAVVDVEGLVDVYLAPPEVLSLLPFGSSILREARQAASDGPPVGHRYPSLATSLSRFGLDATERQALDRLTTQSATNGRIRTANTPAQLRQSAERLNPAFRIDGQVRQVRIWLDMAR